MHTPAPWKILPGESRRVYLVNDSHNQAIGEIVYTDARNPDDAKLIAAAPDLLRCLCEIHSNAADPDWIRARINAVVFDGGLL